ncbi:uncharacterized protein N7484_005915 [Penicillium longicatenatum]|uniref:uncharacterized protein n=1 Tax=Penicillium longicatenatum TaxID=1561947 RepID=UPI0025498E42|nr:uncharacterized protein N7484_005915 [Penicillium longicatenatum]KAJ5643408.1 hypothetical protein N7484_005915 [Penicillium longicatenatum]
MTDGLSMSNGGKGPVVLGVTWAEMGLAFILIILRAKTASVCPSRQLSSGLYGLRWDFVWVIIAFTVALAAQITMTVSVHYGLGTHQSLLPPDQIVNTNLWSWIAQVIAILDLVIARIAVIAFLLTIQSGTRSKGRYLLYAVGATQAIINVIEVGLIFKQCTPTEKLWDSNRPGTCDGIVICSQVGFAQGSIGAFSDFFLAGYPVYVIGRLQVMKLSTKIGLCLIMGGGLIAGIAGINKTIAIASITKTDDLTYAIYKLNTWVLTEMWFIIIFGSIPTLRLFFIKFTQDLKSATGFSSRSSGKRSTGGYMSDREPRQSWVELNDRAPGSWNPHVTAVTSATHDSEDAQRTEENEPNDQQILVTKNTVVSEEYQVRP